MAVYPVCQHIDCSGRRREQCPTQSAHKRYVGWVARWNYSRTEPPLHKVYGHDRNNPKELADICLRGWKTDKDRGDLKMKVKSSDAVTFEAAAEEWWNKVVIAQNRIKDPDRTEKSRVVKWKALFGSSSIQTIKLEDVEEWIEDRRNAGITVNTINRDLKPLRWIFDYAMSKGYIEKSPLTGLESLKGGNIHDRWMTQEEVDRLIAAAISLDDYELAEFIAIGVNTGFRLANLERLTVRDIDGGLIQARQTKSGNPYSVPISPAIEPILRRLSKLHPTGPLLPGRDNNIGRRFREAARQAGLYSDRRDNERVTIHTLRHTFAVLYLKRGGDIYKLSKLLGHRTSAITDEIYARFCPKEKLAQASLISTPIHQLEAPTLKVIG